MALSASQLQRLKGLIDSRYNALVAEIGVDVSRGRSDTALHEELSKEGASSADRAALEQLVRIDDAELARDLDEFRLMQAARSRLEAGSYGACIDCQREISFERLRAQPAALRCVECQHEQEKSRAGQRTDARTVTRKSPLHRKS